MRMSVIAACGLGIAVMFGTTGTAKASPNDYRFEAVRTEVAAAANATIAVRLVHVPDGKAVTNAILFQPKMEMPMEGMAPMVTTVKAVAPDGKGAYPFTTDFSEPGPWTLTVSAKVQGESATIVGTVPFVAKAEDHAAMGNHAHMGGMDHTH